MGQINNAYMKVLETDGTVKDVCLYDSVSDFSNAASDVGYLKVQYNNADAYIAYTNSQSSDSYVNYGTGVRLNVDGTVCYVLTQIPVHELSYDTPVISLSYPTIDANGGTSTPTATYTQVRHNTDGSETTLSGNLTTGGDVESVSYTYTESTSTSGNSSSSINSNTGVVTSDGFILTANSSSATTIGTARVTAVINGISASTSASVKQTSIIGVYYPVWAYDIQENSAQSWNATILENIYFTDAWFNNSSNGGTSGNYQNGFISYMRSYNSYDDAVSGGGVEQLLLPEGVYQVVWEAKGVYDSEKGYYIHRDSGTSAVNAAGYIELEVNR